MGLSSSKHGTYIPTAGKCKRTKIVKYRSSWELNYAQLCDAAKSVVRWEYEQIYIRYVIHGEGHAYLIDFTVYMENGAKFLVEIKPHAFYERALQLRDKNFYKWEAAKLWAAKHNYEFKVITERNIEVLQKAWL